MPSLWRISRYLELTGKGGLLNSNRWHTKGRSIVYMAQTEAGVLLEYLVHCLDDSDLPADCSLLRIDYPETLSLEEVKETQLGVDWPAHREVTQNAGNDWLRRGATALLSVPSAIARSTRNFLLNPEHPDAAVLKIEKHFPFNMDARLQRLVNYATSYSVEIPYVHPDE